jgi:hypothetical protein
LEGESEKLFRGRRDRAGKSRSKSFGLIIHGRNFQWQRVTASLVLVGLLQNLVLLPTISALREQGVRFTKLLMIDPLTGGPDAETYAAC